MVLQAAEKDVLCNVICKNPVVPTFTSLLADEKVVLEKQMYQSRLLLYQFWFWYLYELYQVCPYIIKKAASKLGNELLILVILGTCNLLLIKIFIRKRWWGSKDKYFMFQNLNCYIKRSNIFKKNLWRSLALWSYYLLIWWKVNSPDFLIRLCLVDLSMHSCFLKFCRIYKSI